MMNWDSFEKAAETGPIQLLVKVILVTAVLVALIWGVGTVFGVFGEAANVVQKEFGPAAAVEKYEWFKDASAQLDRKKADLAMYDARIKSLKENKASADSIAQAESERIGVASSYNDLAARYNSSMSKINWRWANTGDVPAGSQALPREYTTGGVQ